MNVYMYLAWILYLMISTISCHMYSHSLGIHQLDITNFDMIIQRPNQLFIIQFFNKNTESHQMMKDYIQLPTLAQQQAQVGVVDGTDPQNKELLTRYKITTFPTIKIFVGHVSAIEASKIARIQPIDYIDRTQTARSILSFALEQIPSNVITLWTSKDEAKIVAQGSTLPRALFFTDKKTSASQTLYKSAALALGSRMQFMEVRKNERKLFDKYDIGSQLPVLLVLPATSGVGKSSKSASSIPGETQRQHDLRDIEEQEDDVGDDPIAATIYDGAWNSYPALLTFLTKFAAPPVVIESSQQPTSAGADRSESTTPVARTPGDDLGYLSDQSCLRAYCLETSQLCAILIVNENNEDAVEWKTKFRTLELGVKSQIASMFRFVWLDGESQTFFLESAFGLTPQHYPQVIVLAGKKARWASYVGAFDAAGITSFLDGIMHGRTRTQSLKSNSLPNLQGDSERCPISIPSKPTPKTETVEPTSHTSIPTSYRSDLPIPLPTDEAGVVLSITSEDIWEKQVKLSKQAWMVAFTASWDPVSKSLLSEWMSAGRRMRNMVRFGIVDCGVTENQVCQRFGVTEFPTIKTFDATTHKIVSVAVDYTGEHTSTALMAAASKLLKPKNVRKVTSESLITWISENPQQIRLLLFHPESEKLPEYFIALSQHFQTFIGFGATKNTDTGLLQQFQVKEMPAIYILKLSSEKDKTTGEHKLEATFYNGPISFTGIAQFLQRALELGGNITEGSSRVPPSPTTKKPSESTETPKPKSATKPSAKDAAKEKATKGTTSEKPKSNSPSKKSSKDEL